MRCHKSTSLKDVFEKLRVADQLTERVLALWGGDKGEIESRGTWEGEGILGLGLGLADHTSS